jgi:hypothetical protein
MEDIQYPFSFECTLAVIFKELFASSGREWQAHLQTTFDNHIQVGLAGTSELSKATTCMSCHEKGWA